MWISPQDHKVVGRFLAEVRARADLSQVELARRLGKPQSFVSAYERGQRRVDVIELREIVIAIGADPVKVGCDLVRAIASDRPSSS